MNPIYEKLQKCVAAVRKITDFEEDLLELLKENKDSFIHQLNELIAILVEQEVKTDEEENDD